MPNKMMFSALCFVDRPPFKGDIGPFADGRCWFDWHRLAVGTQFALDFLGGSRSSSRLSRTASSVTTTSSAQYDLAGMDGIGNHIGTSIRTEHMEANHSSAIAVQDENYRWL